MPHTSFALLTAMRSHRIDNPDVALSQRTGRPNACNLCHIDKPLAWAADRLVDWYDAPPVEMSDDERQISAALLWLLRGDAVQRVIAAWHLGWQPALGAAGTQWQAPFLAHTLVDPYAAVRFVAERSLRRFPEYDSIPYDFLGRQQDRAKAGQVVIERWNSEAEGRSVKAPAELLLTPGLRLQQEAVARLLKQRNDRPITIPE